MMDTSITIHSVYSRPRRALLLTFLLLGLSIHAVGAAPNPITIENARPGTERWRIALSADDTGQQIKGYSSATSVNKGQSINLHISVNNPQAYHIEVYRMGWYGGAGGRLMQSIGPLNGVQQAPPVVDTETGLVRYPWEPSYTLNVPGDWTSGVYLAKLINTEGYENYIVFVVRDDERNADFLYQQPITTYQAYNAYPRGGIGKSLYDVNQDALADMSTSRAYQVSFDRPYSDNGANEFFRWEHDLVRWLEREGYDVTYATNVDVHRQGVDLLRRYKGFFSVGHDEYWSKAMYDAAEAARDSGVNLAFFGSNAVYWQIRLAAGATGAPYRTLVCYKDAALDPETNPSLKTVLWRDLGRAEQALIGVQYVIWNFDAFNTDYIVKNSDNWIYDSNGFSNDDSVPGITGYEVDTLFPNYPAPISQSYTILSESPFVGENGTSVVANSSVYQAPSSAWVFASGTMSWSWALDRPGLTDARIQATTRNILQRFKGAAVDANFNASKNGFNYRDGAFTYDRYPYYATGDRVGSGGFNGGALRVRLGGWDNYVIYAMSGGWRERFELEEAQNLRLSFRYRLTQSSEYENDEYSELIADVDGQRYSQQGDGYIARVTGDGNGGDSTTTGWRKFVADLGTLDAGRHKITIGGFNNKKTWFNEVTDLLIDDVLLVATD